METKNKNLWSVMPGKISYTVFSLCIVFTMLLSSQKASATHAMPIVNLTSSITSTGLIISGSSDGATCSSTETYYLQVELICTMSSYQGVANYSSEPITKVSCVEKPYNPVVIPFSDLCPGTTYKWRVRERLTGNPISAIGPWSISYTFTTPGSPPPPPTVSAHALDTNLLCGNTTAVYGLNSGGCGAIAYTWVEEVPGGSSISLGNGRIKNVSPIVTTTYKVTGRDTCTGFTDTKSVIVYVSPSSATSSFTACPGDTINFLPFVPKQTVGPGIKQTFSNLVKQPIKDLKINYSDIVVSGMNATASRSYTVAAVNINIRHTKDADLQLKLISPGGHVFNLSINNGGTGANYTNTTFTDTAARLVTAGVAPFLGHYKPQETGGFASLIGSPVNGTWRLQITDVDPGNEGAIDDWSIILIDDDFFPNTNYSWSTTAFMTNTSLGSPQVIADQTITYILTLQYLSCTYTHTFNVYAHPKVLYIDPVAPICNGDPAQLNAYGSISYSWSPATGLSSTTISNPIASPASTTTYYLQMQDAIGCKKRDSVVVKVGTNPTAYAGLDATVCAGNPFQLNATGGLTYAWTPDTLLNDASLQSPTVTSILQDTDFIVTVYDAVGCSDKDTVKLNVISDAYFTVANAGICEGGSVMLQASVPTHNYSWSPATGLSSTTIANPIASPAATQEYEVTTSTLTCSYTTKVTVTVSPYPTVNAGSDVEICENATTTLSASGANTYSWSPSDGLSDSNIANPVLTGIFSRTYVLTGEVNGCSNTDTLTVAVKASPKVNVGNDLKICPGSSIDLKAVVDDPSFTFKWTPASSLSADNISSPEATPLVTTQYQVVVTNPANGCSTTRFVNVTIEGQPINVSESITPPSCWGKSDGSIALNVTGGTGGGFDYAWSPNGPNGPALNNLPAGFYIITITDKNSLCQHKTTAVINQPLKMDVKYSVENSTCQRNNGYIEVLKIDNGIAPYIYSFNDSLSTSGDSHGLFAGNNIISVRDSKGCEFIDTVLIANLGAPVLASFTPSTVKAEVEDEIYFTNNSIGANYYNWYFGNGEDSNDENTMMAFEMPGTYRVLLFSKNDVCSDSSSVEIVIEESLDFMIPNVFTPNGDGKNDEFTISGKGMRSFKGEIHNRWGKKVFEWENSKKGWDGDGAENGTYFYVITFSTLSGEPRKFSGHVTLLR
jgi:gliding motility-associated-like protein